nr:MAG TPA: hypothetical protein [Caudoviricetes sp.]
MSVYHQILPSLLLLPILIRTLCPSHGSGTILRT